jgi:hypothetical protein
MLDAESIAPGAKNKFCHSTHNIQLYCRRRKILSQKRAGLSILAFPVRLTSRSKRSSQETVMARQCILRERVRSIAGGVLVGLGLYILFVNLDRAASQLSDFLGTGGEKALGILPSIALATSQVVQAHGVGLPLFREDLMRILLPFWPLSLVLIGAVLLRDVLADKVRILPTPEKYFQNENVGCRFRCHSFDV